MKKKKPRATKPTPSPVVKKKTSNTRQRAARGSSNRPTIPEVVTPPSAPQQPRRLLRNIEITGISLFNPDRPADAPVILWQKAPARPKRGKRRKISLEEFRADDAEHLGESTNARSKRLKMSRKRIGEMRKELIASPPRVPFTVTGGPIVLVK